MCLLRTGNIYCASRYHRFCVYLSIPAVGFMDNQTLWQTFMLSHPFLKGKGWVPASRHSSFLVEFEGFHVQVGKAFSSTVLAMFCVYHPPCNRVQFDKNLLNLLNIHFFSFPFLQSAIIFLYLFSYDEINVLTSVF